MDASSDERPAGNTVSIPIVSAPMVNNVADVTVSAPMVNNVADEVECIKNKVIAHPHSDENRSAGSGPLIVLTTVSSDHL